MYRRRGQVWRSTLALRWTATASSQQTGTQTHTCSHKEKRQDCPKGSCSRCLWISDCGLLRSYVTNYSVTYILQIHLKFSKYAYWYTHIPFFIKRSMVLMIFIFPLHLSSSADVCAFGYRHSRAFSWAKQGKKIAALTSKGSVHLVAVVWEGRNPDEYWVAL